MIDSFASSGTNEGIESIKKTMAIPYSHIGVPWVTFIGPYFFTLSTNEAKSDRIICRFRMLDDKTVMIPIIRGRSSPNGDERGILTAEHGRVLGALVVIWVRQGCKYAEFKNGAVTCYCDVPMRKLADLVGWTNFGGAQLKHLKKVVTDLKDRPYYLDLDSVKEFRSTRFKSFGFTLLEYVTILDRKKYRLRGTIIRIQFSDPFSRQLLARHTETKNLELLTVRSELAFLLRLYLEPILICNGDEAYEVGLSELIKHLQLPAAKWHHGKSTRKQQFQEVVDELNGKRIVDGKIISVHLGLRGDDYVLIGHLKWGFYSSEGPADVSGRPESTAQMPAVSL